MDWFKGKSTGNPWVFTIKLIGLSCMIFALGVHWSPTQNVILTLPRCEEISPQQCISSVCMKCDQLQELVLRVPWLSLGCYDRTGCLGKVGRKSLSHRSSFEPIRSAALRRQAEERKRVCLARFEPCGDLFQDRHQNHQNGGS